MAAFSAGQIGGTGLGLESLGAGISAASSYASAQVSKVSYQASSNIAALEGQANQLNWNQAQLTGRRNQMEVLRNEQRARSLALSSAANQGAQFGSGLQGGFGQVQGTSGNNLLGINQNLAIGSQLNTVNQSISQQKIAEGNYQSKSATASGFGALGGGVSSLGKDLLSAAPLLLLA